MEADKNTGKNVAPMTTTGGLLTRAEFQKLADVPPEVEWFADIRNIRTRRAYQIDLREFMGFVGISRPEEFRISLFEYLCECNAVLHNPVDGVTRPKVESYEGKTPALGDHQARELLHAPDRETLKGK